MAGRGHEVLFAPVREVLVAVPVAFVAVRITHAVPAHGAAVRTAGAPLVALAAVIGGAVEVRLATGLRLPVALLVAVTARPAFLATDHGTRPTLADLAGVAGAGMAI